ncbi:hypothetical protein M9H77_23527 [Catharanthus roseus]|uniref:Uncharacterized protein n=1 Tax=Catharanthus roseus TaxID=4058 RepID=A0ACC0AUH9_CATRO|nr:hypothetical protein M9H77_23527 [Catharanthus roseus]
MGEMSTKANELSQAQDVIDRKVIHHEKKNTCTFVKKEKSREENLKSVVSTKESEEKRKESECLIENHESLKEEQEKEKQDEIEKMCRNLKLKTRKMKEFLLEALQNHKLSSFYIFLVLIQSQLLNFLTTTCGTKPNHGMKVKEEGMEKKLSIGFEDTPLCLSLNLFLLYHEFSFRELKFLELYASYVTLVGNVMINPFTCDLAFDIDHMLKCSSPCAYLEKRLLEFLDELISLLYCKEELGGLSPLKDMEHQIEWRKVDEFGDQGKHYNVFNYQGAIKETTWRRNQLSIEKNIPYCRRQGYPYHCRVRAQPGSLSESRHIGTAVIPKLSKPCMYHDRLDE